MMPSGMRVLLTGATGQDGRYLAGQLRQDGSLVVEAGRRCSAAAGGKFVPVDLAEPASLAAAFRGPAFDEIHHLGGITVASDCEADSARAWRVNVESTQVLLDLAWRHSPEAKVFLASSCLAFGEPVESPQTETTPMNPLSVYARSKAALLPLAQEARDRGQFVSVGILYNHESPLRTAAFVSRKIVDGAVAIAAGRAELVQLGNLAAVRDWSHAADFVRGFRTVLSAECPDDFIFASGTARTVAEFCEEAFGQVGLDWRDHVRGGGTPVQAGLPYVGDAARLRRATGWRPEVSFPELVGEMLAAAAETAQS